MTTDVRMIQLLMDLRRQGITDTEVLSAMEQTPREVFVPEMFRDRSFDNTALPIDCGQTISQPIVVAYMTAALELKPTLRVLEIGTGSGYQAAVLARLVKRVYTIERIPELAQAAQERLKKLLLFNIDVRNSDGMRGWPGQAPFDRIIVTAAARDSAPQELLNQLNIKGSLVIPIDRGVDGQVLVRIRRTAQGFQSTDLLPVKFVPLLEGVAKSGGAVE
ncbi:MAG: protein-L-isoaspartate(D-aspartate) O-methyltransferase [Alphaproteobacteria bacterium]|nr:protein-L-isoaspartate(D-aspartate) O-methyltransferase [Alphaproteobacteria bacterium]